MDLTIKGANRHIRAGPKVRDCLPRPNPNKPQDQVDTQWLQSQSEPEEQEKQAANNRGQISNPPTPFGNPQDKSGPSGTSGCGQLSQGPGLWYPQETELWEGTPAHHRPIRAVVARPGVQLCLQPPQHCPTGTRPSPATLSMAIQIRATYPGCTLCLLLLGHVAHSGLHPHPS